MCPSQTEGTYDDYYSRCSKSYLLFVTNLNAAQILLHPKWPQILVTASSSCFECEPNFLYVTSKLWDSPVETSKVYLNLDRGDFSPASFHILKLLLSEHLVRLWQETILPKATEPTPRADRNRPFWDLDPLQIRYFPDIEIISFDDWTLPFTGSNCPVHQRNP